MRVIAFVRRAVGDDAGLAKTEVVRPDAAAGTSCFWQREQSATDYCWKVRSNLSLFTFHSYGPLRNIFQDGDAYDIMASDAE